MFIKGIKTGRFRHDRISAGIRTDIRLIMTVTDVVSINQGTCTSSVLHAEKTDYTVTAVISDLY